MSVSNKSKRSAYVAHLTRAALIAAIIFVMTSFLKLPTATGYVHLGDAAVCLAASVLPAPIGLVTAALGGGLSDLAAGYPMWILPTAVIKAAMTLAFTSKGEKILCLRNCIALAIAVIINAAGYYLGGSIIYGNFAVSLPEIPTNLLQGAVGAVIFSVMGAFLDANSRVRKIIRGR